MIKASGYRHAFFFFGLLQGMTILVLGVLLVKPVAVMRDDPSRAR